MHLKVRPLSLLYIHDINYSISLFYQGSIGENIYSMNKSKFYWKWAYGYNLIIFMNWTILDTLVTINIYNSLLIFIKKFAVLFKYFYDWHLL